MLQLWFEAKVCLKMPLSKSSAEPAPVVVRANSAFACVPLPGFNRPILTAISSIILSLNDDIVAYPSSVPMIIPVVKTYPSEAGSYSVNNGLQILGGYGFCSDFILQQYYRDIRISAIYEGTTGIQSQDLLGRKITMGNGSGLALLSAEIMETINASKKYEALQPYAATLTEKLELCKEILQKLMPHAMKGDFERYLADASVFMEFFSLILIGWTWLEMATAAQQSLDNSNATYSKEFYIGKIETMKYFYTYELPKTLGQAAILMNSSAITIKKEQEEYIN